MIPVDVPRWTVTVPPTIEPVPLDDIKSHCRIVGTTDDGYLAGVLRAARGYCEALQGRAYLTQTRTLTLDAFPDTDYIALPGAPLASVTSVSYTKEDATSDTFSSGDYHVDTASQPGRIVLKANESWPTDSLISTGGVVITYVCGHAPVTSTVTISNATPAVVTWSSHGLTNGNPVWFSTTASLPTGLTAERTYYVVQSAAGSFQLASAPGGSSIATSSAGSGTHTAYSVWRVSSSILHAIKFLAGHWYENREATADQSAGNLTPTPIALQALIEADRIWGYA